MLRKLNMQTLIIMIINLKRWILYWGTCRWDKM